MDTEWSNQEFLKSIDAMPSMSASVEDSLDEYEWDVQGSSPPTSVAESIATAERGHDAMESERTSQV